MTASAKPVTTVGIDLSDTFLALCKKDPHVLTRLFGQSVVPASKENAASSMTRSSGTPTFYTIKINEKSHLVAEKTLQEFLKHYQTKASNRSDVFSLANMTSHSTRAKGAITSIWIQLTKAHKGINPLEIWTGYKEIGSSKIVSIRLITNKDGSEDYEFGTVASEKEVTKFTVPGKTVYQAIGTVCVTTYSTTAIGSPSTSIDHTSTASIISTTGCVSTAMG